MKHRTLYLITLIITLASLTGCQTKVIYATPEITGQVIDKQTNQPIMKVNASINNKQFDTTDAQGSFTVPAITIKYTLNIPSHQEMTAMRDAKLVFNKLGYEKKSYVISELGSLPMSFIEKTSIDIGQIYLNPVPVGKEGEYKTYYLTLDFCKPTESQKEVDCIPVPEGKTYAEVSPNQPLD